MRLRLLAATIAVAVMATGCAGRQVPAGPTAGQASQQTETPPAASRQAENSSAAEELARTRQALHEAQEEIRWLHIDLAKRPGFDPPRSAVEAYAGALIRRNGATARIFLSQSMRTKLNMPAHGIGTSNPHLTRFEILGEKAVGATHQFQVHYFSEYTGSPEVPGAVETYTVESLKDDTGNDAWLITETTGGAE